MKKDVIDWLINIPKKNSERVFIIDDICDETLTFGQLNKVACVVGNSLKELGLKKGDRIAILMENSLSLVKIYFGCLYSGLVVVPINPILTKNEIGYIIEHSNAKVIIVSSDTKKLINANLLARKKKLVLSIFNETNPIYQNNDIVWNLNELKFNPYFKPFQGVSSNDDIAIVYTSGTTSKPKAVVHRIRDVVDNARVFGKIMGINSHNRFYNILALTYLGGYYNLLLLPYVLESSVVLAHVFDPKMAVNFWDPVIKHRVNILWLVPSIMSILLEVDRGNKGGDYCKKNISLLLVGTAPLSTKLKKDFENRYGVQAYENYGLSETLFVSTNSPKHLLYNRGVGKVLPDVSIRIIDKNGKLLSAGNEGEILVKSPYLMKGYHDYDKQDLESKIKTKWFETGDLGILSKNKILEITGRKKDLIIRGGINISPKSIEDVLLKHRSILECAVIGIPHKIQGEEIIAVVRVNFPSNFRKIKKELFSLCKENLAQIKQPAKIIQLSEFPHATYGKIQKNKIRAWFIQKQKELDNINEKKSAILQIKDHNFVPSKIVNKSIEALSISYNTKVYEKQRKGEDVVVLSLGEAFFNIPLFSFERLPHPKTYHYSHSRGIPELRQKISKYFFEMYDVSFDYETEIIITAGSKIAIHMSLMSILNPNDEVIIHEPAWVSYPEQIKLCHGIPIRIPYYKSVYDFENYITKKTKMIIINNPNNPTGKVYTLDELTFLHNLAKKYKLIILSDEAYSDFVLNRDDFISFANLDTKKEHSIIVNSISKNFGISGWRIGYVITNAKLINQLLKLNQHLITCSPTILEYYVAKYFDNIINITKPQIADLVKKRQEIIRFMDSISLKYLPGNTTFYIFTSIADSKLSSNEFCSHLLQNYHVSTVPGIGYGKSCDGFIRVSVGAETTDRIKNGLQSIKELVSKTSH